MQVGEVFSQHGVMPGRHGQIGWGRAFGCTRTIDQDVHGTSLRVYGVQHRLRLSGITQVRTLHVNATGHFGKILGKFSLHYRQLLWVPRDERHMGTFFQENTGASQTDAFAAAGDQDMLLLKLQIHLELL
jgi:hypothetical protein